MSELASRECVPCKRGDPPLGPAEIARLHAELGGDWVVVDQHHLEKAFKFPNFVEALAFTNQIGELAEQAGHHPDLLLAWGKVTVTIWTHRAKGLTESDFILAAKIDRIEPEKPAASHQPRPGSKSNSPDPEILAALGRLAGGVAHEFNNLVTIIQGNAALLENLPNPEDAHFVQEILKAARRASHLSNQLHLLSGHPQIEIAQVNLGNFLTNTQPALRTILGDGMTLQVNCEPNLPSIRADASLLEQCLAGIASHAREITRGSGRLSLEAQKPTEAESRNRFVRLDVRYGSPAMVAEDLTRLFEPLIAKGGSRHRFEMAMAFGIIHQHRGRIEVEPEQTGSTALRILLPTAT